ncbi:MAG TPA: CRISPR-associated endoribonuclease Cas6 [Desulfobacterales bacterium]|nr:MAG: CRISPR-associated endoribonuclease Cas6 [Deltaproteobacteria bacterium]HDG98497.1 CRISPR-associated endoribonuclease Cas6 [Desulfobacterales bacterium]
MRLKITMQSRRGGFLLPFNYNYKLMSALYHLIYSSDQAYSLFLHNQGFVHKGKPFKLFTFSELKINGPYRVTKEGLQTKTDQVAWYISTPVDRSLENIVLGIFNNNSIELKGNGDPLLFNVIGVETMPGPDFRETMRFKCLSPIFIDTFIDDPVTGRKKSWTLNYFRDREKFVKNIRNNLVLKYEIIHKQTIKPATFRFTFDEDYIGRKKGKITSLIIFKAKSGNPIKLRCFNAPFEVETNPELIRVGYECGFGSKNTNGLGMVDQATRKP